MRASTLIAKDGTRAQAAYRRLRRDDGHTVGVQVGGPLGASGAQVWKGVLVCRID